MQCIQGRPQRTDKPFEGESSFFVGWRLVLKGKGERTLRVLREATRRRQRGMACEQEGSDTPWPLTAVWARGDQWDSGWGYLSVGPVAIGVSESHA